MFHTLLGDVWNDGLQIQLAMHRFTNPSYLDLLNSLEIAGAKKDQIEGMKDWLTRKCVCVFVVRACDLLVWMVIFALLICLVFSRPGIPRDHSALGRQVARTSRDTAAHVRTQRAFRPTLARACPGESNKPAHRVQPGAKNQRDLACD